MRDSANVPSCAVIIQLTMKQEVNGADLDLKTKYVVDAKGRKTAAILDIRAYRRLLEYMEDLEDRLRIDKVTKRGASYRPYTEIREELKRSGRL